jgi:hypothetical protein
MEGFAMRWTAVSHRLAAVALVVATGDAGVVAGTRLRPETAQAWDRYVAAVEQRRADESRDPARFFAMDFLPDAAADRQTVLAGGIVITPVRTAGGGRRSIDVPSAMVHHWRGAIFLPHVDLAHLMATLETKAPPTGPDILRAAVLERSPGAMRVFLRLQRTRIVTVVYDTEHRVTFAHESATRASSVSVATKIAEVANAGARDEYERAPGDDHGFLWRLLAYWRYEAVDGGVIAECESISLSRDVPFGLQTIAGPLIARTARESMTRTLEQIREIGLQATGHGPQATATGSRGRHLTRRT